MRGALGDPQVSGGLLPGVGEQTTQRGAVVRFLLL